MKNCQKKKKERKNLFKHWHRKYRGWNGAYLFCGDVRMTWMKVDWWTSGVPNFGGKKLLTFKQNECWDKLVQFIKGKNICT